MVFSHEKLTVYQRSLEFIDFMDKIIPDGNNISAHYQLDKASTSIPLNIPEGTGKFTNKDKSHYYDIGRGSALECAACLDVLLRRKKISKELNEEGKRILFEVVSMLVGLTKSISIECTRSLSTMEFKILNFLNLNLNLHLNLGRRYEF